MDNFINFIQDVTNDTTLQVSFTNVLQKSQDEKQLNSWFDEKGYKIALEQCRQILEKDKAHKNNKLKYFMNSY